MRLPLWYVHLVDRPDFGAWYAAPERNAARTMCLRSMRDANYDNVRYIDLRAIPCRDPWNTYQPLKVEVEFPRPLATYEVAEVCHDQPNVRIETQADDYWRREYGVGGAAEGEGGAG